MELTLVTKLAILGIGLALLVAFFGNNWSFRIRQHFGEGKKQAKVTRSTIDFRALKQANATIDRMNQYFERGQGSSDMPRGVLGDYPSGRMLDFKERSVQKAWLALSVEIKALCERYQSRPGSRPEDVRELDAYKAKRDEFLRVVNKSYA